MNFIYPQSILSPRLPDEMFQDEADALRRTGHTVFLVNGEKLSASTSPIKPLLPENARAVYRGWMLTTTEYKNLTHSIENAASTPFTSLPQYIATHHLPNWYQKISDLTPETVVLSLDTDWTSALKNLGWSRFFIKDFVKSLKTSVGSIIERAEDIHLVATEMEKYRGHIEGGLCIRRVEDFLPQTEQRYFVLNGKPYSAVPVVEIPPIVSECAARIESQFFSVDVISRTDGTLRIVEIGDGQVSDLVGWSPERFVKIWDTVN